MAKRKMSRKQRRYFGRSARRTVRRVGRSVRRSARKAYRSGGGFGGILPVSIKEAMVDFGAGATMPWTNNLVAPYTDGILEPLGSYKDEARTALIGMVLYKFGGAIHPLVKEAGRSYFKFAVTSAGLQTGSNFIVTTSSMDSSIYQ